MDVRREGGDFVGGEAEDLKVGEGACMRREGRQLVGFDIKYQYVLKLTDGVWDGFDGVSMNI